MAIWIQNGNWYGDCDYQYSYTEPGADCQTYGEDYYECIYCGAFGWSEESTSVGPHEGNDWGYCDVCGEDLLFAPSGSGNANIGSGLEIQPTIKNFAIIKREETAYIESLGKDEDDT